MANRSGTPQPQTPATNPLRPMGLGLSLLFFGLPTLAMIASFYLLMPALIDAGLLPFYANSFALIIPLAGLLVAALVAYRLEGHPLTWSALKARFRWRRMNGRAWLWTIGVWLLQSALLVLIDFGLLLMSIMTAFAHDIREVTAPRQARSAQVS